MGSEKARGRYMPESRVKVPEVRTREVSIELPDALVNLFGSDGVRSAGTRTAGSARLVRDVGVAGLRTVSSRAPRVRREDITGAARSAREGARPVVTGVSTTAAAAAQKLASRSAALASDARDLGGTVAARARTQWIPTARTRVQETAPVVGEALQTGVTKAGKAATVAGATATVGAKVAARTAGTAVSRAGSAVNHALTQVFRLTFWLGVLIWLLIRIFYPQRERREALYRRIRSLTGFESGY